MNHQQMLKPLVVGAAALVALGLLGLPVGTYLPFLVVLACPLMMVLMMRGMSHGSDEQDHHGHSHAGHTRGEKL